MTLKFEFCSEIRVLQVHQVAKISMWREYPIEPLREKLRELSRELTQLFTEYVSFLNYYFDILTEHTDFTKVNTASLYVCFLDGNMFMYIKAVGFILGISFTPYIVWLSAWVLRFLNYLRWIINLTYLVKKYFMAKFISVLAVELEFIRLYQMFIQNSYHTYTYI